jgi:hypothetical protein
MRVLAFAGPHKAGADPNVDEQPGDREVAARLFIRSMIPEPVATLFGEPDATGSLARRTAR